MAKWTKLDKINALEERLENRSYRGKSISLKPYARFYRLAETAKKLPGSKNLVISTYVAMLGINEGESSASLFSSSFSNLCKKMAFALAYDKNAGTQEYLARLLQQSFIATIGFIDLSIKQAKANDEYPLNTSLFNEFLGSALASSDLLFNFYKELTESIYLIESEKKAAILESFTYLFLAIGLIKNKEATSDLLRAFKTRIEKGIKALDSLPIPNEVKSLTQIATIALDEQNYEPLFKEINSLIKSSGIKIDELEQDMNSIKRLFGLLKGQYAHSSQIKESIITFTG